MPDPGPGAMTFFYTNQQSARLLFYHDHSYGITRLNVYAGEAAGYLITDPTEKALIANGTLPSTQIPLILADKTFVAQRRPDGPATDPTWNKSEVGRRGQPVVPPRLHADPEPRQLAPAPTHFGRWAVRPLVLAADHEHHSTARGPTRTTTPTATPTSQCRASRRRSRARRTCRWAWRRSTTRPLVNGTAYPTTTLQPKSYRFRVLNAADDRYFNLQLYVRPTRRVPRWRSTPTEVAAALDDPNVSPTPDTTQEPPSARAGSRSAPRAASCRRR